MFILFALLMLVNYAADKEKFLFAYRFSVAGMPVNVLDVLMGVACLFAPFAIRKARIPGEQTHRGLKWTLAMTTAGCLVGFGGGAAAGVEVRYVIDMTRNVAALALSVFIGYYAVSNLRQARWAALVVIVSSAASAFFVLLFLRESAEALSWSGTSFHMLRNTTKGGDLGVVGAAFATFALVSGIAFFPRPVLFGLLLLCMGGAFALPHRSSWLAAGGAILFAGLVLPRLPFGKRVARGAVYLGVIGGILLSGVLLYSRLTGRNFGEYVMIRLQSMNPLAEATTKDNRAWDTRLPGAIVEIRLWLQSPLIGNGFGFQNFMTAKGEHFGVGYRHNVWTASLAEGGVPLFLGYLLPCVLCVVVGKRLVNDRMDRATVMVGVIGATQGVYSLLMATATMSINTQRQAIALGMITGLVLRVRDMQLATLRSYDGYAETSEEAGEFVLPAGHYA
jgi:hypothetical protein